MPADNLFSIVVMLWAVRLLIIVALTSLGPNNSRMLRSARNLYGFIEDLQNDFDLWIQNRQRGQAYLGTVLLIVG